MNDADHDLVGAYALDAVDDVERRRFERHLNECERCRRELDQLQAAAGQLSLDTALQPPAHLRRTVLDAAAAHGGRQAPHAATTQPASPDTSAPDGASAGPQQKGSSSRRLFLGAAAAVVLGGGSLGVWRATREPSQAEVAADILDDPAATRARTTYEGSNVTVARTRDGRAAVRIAPAPRNVAGRRYTVWADSADGSLRNAGELPDGGADATMLLESGLRSARGVAVTLEKEGAHPRQPTSAPLFAVSFG